MKVETLLITPEMAKGYLKNNTSNRNVKDQRITKYANEMKNGLWKTNTGEFIKIAKNGRLIDGQHRLLAIIKANVSVQLGVISGLEEEVFSVIDTGVNRNAGDVFKIEDIPNGTHIASIIQNYFILKSGRIIRNANSRKSNQEVLNYYKLNPEFWQRTHSVTQGMYRAFARILEMSFIGSFWVLLKEKDEAKANAFMNQLTTGNDIINPTISTLRQKLIADKVGNKRLEKEVRDAYIIKAWNAFRTNKILKVIKYDKQTESFPIIL